MPVITAAAAINTRMMDPHGVELPVLVVGGAAAWVVADVVVDVVEVKVVEVGVVVVDDGDVVVVVVVEVADTLVEVVTTLVVVVATVVVTASVVVVGRAVVVVVNRIVVVVAGSVVVVKRDVVVVGMFSVEDVDDDVVDTRPDVVVVAGPDEPPLPQPATTAPDTASSATAAANGRRTTAMSVILTFWRVPAPGLRQGIVPEVKGLSRRQPGEWSRNRRKRGRLSMRNLPSGWRSPTRTSHSWWAAASVRSVSGPTSPRRRSIVSTGPRIRWGC
jgi:hypothetical protein